MIEVVVIVVAVVIRTAIYCITALNFNMYGKYKINTDF